jgi:serine protease Do
LGIIALWSGAAPSWAAELTPQQIYERDAPGVVLIIGNPEKGEGGSGGTGSIISQDGLVLTNAHVVVDPKTSQPFPRLFVFFKPDRVTGNQAKDLARQAKVGVVAFDRALDLALLRIEKAPPDLRVIRLGNPDQVRIGDRAAAIGHPEQGGLWTLTTGVVSTEFEDFNGTPGKHVFQTETSLNRGNSGGPLLNAEGHIIGVNTSIARLAADGLPITSISFALKSSVARNWLRTQSVPMDYAAPPVERPQAPPPVVETPKPPAPQAPPPVAQEPAKPTSPPPPPPVADAPKTPAPKPPPPKAAQPSGEQIHTEKRPYNLDGLVRDYARVEHELSDMADEMRKRTRPR